MMDRAIDRFLMGEAYVASAIPAHLDMLCRKIGPRWGGSEGERRAAEYIHGRLKSYGLQNTRLEDFAIDSWESGPARIGVSASGRSQEFEGRPALFCPSVDLSGPLVNVGYGMEHEVAALRRLLRGGIALIDAGLEPFSLPAPLLTRLELLERAGALVAISPHAAGGRRTAHISASDWRDRGAQSGPLPLAQVSREDGVELARLAGEGAAASVKVDARTYKAVSRNVVGELPGRRWPNEYILLGAHYDTTPDSPGANDNGSGTSVLVETARLLGALQSETGSQPGRSIRFVCFGSEEQTLQGSYAYVDRHHGPEPHPRLMINLDELATGNMKGVALVFPELRGLVQKALDSMDEGLRCHVMAQLDTSGDMFPFARAGIPSAMLWRWRFVGRHPDAAFGHSSNDTIDKVRVRELKEYAGLLARLIYRLSNVPPNQWPRSLPVTTDIEARLEAERGSVIRTM